MAGPYNLFFHSSPTPHFKSFKVVPFLFAHRHIVSIWLQTPKPRLLDRSWFYSNERFRFLNNVKFVKCLDYFQADVAWSWVLVGFIKSSLKMLSGGDNETYGANKDPRPRHISPEETKSFNMNAGRESLRRKQTLFLFAHLKCFILRLSRPAFILNDWVSSGLICRGRESLLAPYVSLSPPDNIFSDYSPKSW